jgi:hypothetical protein
MLGARIDRTLSVVVVDPDCSSSAFRLTIRPPILSLTNTGALTCVDGFICAARCFASASIGMPL